MTASGELDPAFRSASRIRVAAYLSGCDEAEFQAVQTYCELTPSNLSKLVSAMEEIGYVSARKGYVGKTPRTWLALTALGRSALAAHLNTLKKIAESARIAGHTEGRR
ncbi:transcriptional regulator [Nocardia sp. KC 131]|uniref:transcriptional regulator n=1 Tax=Nocardia arseniciresistens TaxID=3392119 RepID=UPI00398ED87F